MKKILGAIIALFTFVNIAIADTVLVIDSGYSTVAASVVNRLQAAGHTATTVTSVPANFTGYQQVWDLRYATALSSSEVTLYSSFVTNGGFVYFTTENPGCCQARNDSVAALVTALGGGTTTIGANYAMTNNVSSNVNTTYMTNGITVNYAAVSAIVNSQGIPLISDGNGAVSGMSSIGRAGALGNGVTGTIVTVADINWMDSSRMVIGGSATTAQQQNVTALDDIIRGIAAGTVAGTISASGNGAGSQQQSQTPTVVSTAAGTPTVSSSTSNGTATSTNAATRGLTTNASNVVLGTTVVTTTKNDVAAKAGNNINVTRTTTLTGVTPRTTTIVSTTPVTTVTTTVTPRTTTTVTTPVTITTYSDGSTTSTNGTPVTTTSTTNVTTTSTSTTNEVVTTVVQDTITQSTSSDQTASVSAVGLKDAIAVRNFNPFLVDVISTKDGAWATPLMGVAKTGNGSFNTSALGFGAQKTFENNTLGIAGTFNKANSKGFENSKSDSDSYGATAYIMNKQNAVWTKFAVGFSSSEYNTSTSIPIFALVNSSKVKVNNYYADLTFYGSKQYAGFRPLIGVTMNESKISSKSESGSPLLSTLPEKNSSFEARPYAGVRYDFNDNIGIETRVTQSKDFKTVAQVRTSVKKEIFKNTYIDVSGGFDKSSNYTAAVGMIGLKINF